MTQFRKAAYCNLKNSETQKPRIIRQGFLRDIFSNTEKVLLIAEICKNQKDLLRYDCAYSMKNVQFNTKKFQNHKKVSINNHTSVIFRFNFTFTIDEDLF